MKAEIISVGTELLMGQILDTNARFIAQRLAEAGVDHYYSSTVGDNEQRLFDTVKRAAERSDIVIITGGLGPTGDDITKETAARVAGKRLVLDEKSLSAMKERFERVIHRPMSENNAKQAMMPEGCIILKNNNGTAPGCIIETDGCAIVLMPGPPKEMEPMFDESVMPYLARRSGRTLYTRELRVFGIGESTVDAMLADMMQAQTNPTIAPYALSGEMKLRVTAKCADKAEGERLVKPIADEITSRLGDAVYSTDGLELYEVCAGLMRENGATLAVAESCTGGMIGELITSVSGASEVYGFGFITYANEAKEQILGVKHETLEKYGAVSGETAREMAEGIRKTACSDIGLATTGIAGPGGGTPEKPVGLVYIAAASDKGTVVERLDLGGSRERIRRSAALSALMLLKKTLDAE